MALYLFSFGFQSKVMEDTDLEDSTCLWIDAPTPETALEWGCEVATRFVAEAFPGARNWKEAGYAHWLEDDPKILEWAKNESPRPIVDFGKFPMHIKSLAD